MLLAHLEHAPRSATVSVSDDCLSVKPVILEFSLNFFPVIP